VVILKESRKKRIPTRSDRTSTSEKLARVLEKQNDPDLKQMIQWAREGKYDDYKSPSPTPIMDLVSDLREKGYPELADRAIDGEFDAQRWEAEEWFLEEGRHLLADSSLFGGKGKKPHETV